VLITKGVLILGRFTERKRVLDGMRMELRCLDDLPDVLVLQEQE